MPRPDKSPSPVRYSNSLPEVRDVLPPSIALLQTFVLDGAP